MMAMMDFGEFKQAVAENIRNFLPEKFADAQISLHEVTKSNDRHRTGVAIQTKDSGVTPNIYLEQYYAQYRNGRDMEDILRNIAEERASYELGNAFEPDSIMDFERAKDKITCRLVNAEMNEGYLSDKPHRQMEDLAVMYAVDLGSHDGSYMSAPITESLMEQYGISAQELHEIALHNLSESPIEFKSMRDTMIEMMFPEGFPDKDMMASLLFPETDAVPMYVLSNAERQNGAAAVLDSRTMESIAKQLGGDYVVIPSSIHEVIILPVTEATDRQEIEQMIRNVNAGDVAPEDRLSDHAYQYDSLTHELVRMDKMEERQAQRAEEPKGAAQHGKENRKPEKERVSMKDRLAQKKAEAVKNEAGREKTLPSQARAEALG